MTHIAVFASGSGTNAENIITYFAHSKKAKVSLVLSNNPDAFVLERAKKYSIPTCVFNREDFYTRNTVLQVLETHHIDFVVLAGFLWLVPSSLIKKFPGKIINIHPALLPAYGGKGMYGDKVHAAVLAAGEKESGITIHYVNDRFDEGEIIFQAKCVIEKTDTPASLAQKIHALEYRHYPEVIERLVG